MKPQRINSIEVKKMNRNAIYKYLYRREPLSIQEIAASLGLSLPTVTHNIKELQERGLVMETGQFESTGGRKARAIAYNPRARYAIGLDITRNHVAIVMIDLSATVVHHVRTNFSFRNDPAYFAGVGRLVERFIHDTEIARDSILGVGIALPAILSHDNRKVEFAVVIDFMGGTIEHFSEHIPYPCVFVNDANAGGMAEFWGDEQIRNVVYLSLNNSVGGSIIINGNLYPGLNQRSGEFGHMTIVPGGRRCYCGQLGCVDAYCNAKILSDSADGSIRKFFDLLRQGSARHLQIWEEYVSHLVTTVNNLRMLYDCNVIVGGYVGAYLDEHLDELRHLLAARNTFERDGTYLQACRYKLEATAVGAALQFVKPFIDQV